MLAFGFAAVLTAAPALAQVAAQIAAAVADPGRPEADRARDADRKPVDVLGYADVKPGDKVAELIPGGGYFTRILAKVVGPNGHVYAVIPALPAQAPADIQSLQAIAKANPNVTLVEGPLLAFRPPQKLDVVWTSENYHDLRNPRYGRQDIPRFNKMVFDALKPGGVFYIEDYAAAAGAGATQTATLHRIDPATVKQEVEAAGFRLELSSDILHHAEDNHTLAIFDPAIRRGHADRLVMRFRKPR